MFLKKTLTSFSILEMNQKVLYSGSIGEHLYDLARWASLPVQIVGYLPLTAKTYLSSGNGNRKTFKFTWASIPPYFSAFLTVASFTWCLMYFWRYEEFKSFIQFKSPTETGAFNLMILTTNISGIYAKLFGLMNGKKYEDFWERTRALLYHFHHPIDSKDHTKAPEEFQAIRSSCKLEIVMMLIPVTIHCLYFYVWILITSLQDDANSGFSELTNTDTQVYLGLGFGYLVAFLHVCNGIWMNVFVKIYSQCLVSISKELKDLNRKYENRHNMELGPSAANTISKASYNNPVRGNAIYVDSGFKPLSLHLKGILDKLALVDHELSRFNDFFGTLLFLQVSNCVTNLLVFSFFACLWMGRGKWKDGFLETVVPLYIYGKELLDMGTVAEELSAAADSVLISLAEDVMLDNLSEEIFLRIQIISTQLCTKPPVISARQFFTINRGLVTSVLSALATFLVVLVQFRDQDDADSQQVQVPASIPIANAANITLKS